MTSFAVVLVIIIIFSLSIGFINQNCDFFSRNICIGIYYKYHVLTCIIYLTRLFLITCRQVDLVNWLFCIYRIR